mmetsp:Transcript_177809/g.570226  ORF Transcript_177809/g.570226 Transcript_177809/m.570226 type:complete len:213 (-) Transcript_177809:93-731(-)
MVSEELLASSKRCSESMEIQYVNTVFTTSSCCGGREISVVSFEPAKALLNAIVRSIVDRGPRNPQHLARFADRLPGELKHFAEICLVDIQRHETRRLAGEPPDVPQPTFQKQHIDPCRKIVRGRDARLRARLGGSNGFGRAFDAMTSPLGTSPCCQSMVQPRQHMPRGLAVTALATQASQVAELQRQRGHIVGGDGIAEQEDGQRLAWFRRS